MPSRSSSIEAANRSMIFLSGELVADQRAVRIVGHCLLPYVRNEIASSLRSSQ
jgi:hypothetical protein